MAKNNSSQRDISLSSYKKNNKLQHVLMKVETHNHPTAISPFAGASTGAGGEIRDEGATGRGSKPKAGLTGFTVSKMNFEGESADKSTVFTGSAACPRYQHVSHQRSPSCGASYEH